MKDIVIIKGKLSGQPQRRGGITEFFLECSSQSFHVIRMDTQWQIKDLLFLCDEQILRVMGKRKDGEILADRVEIIDCSARNYIKERQYGDSCVTETDPGDSAV